MTGKRTAPMHFQNLQNLYLYLYKQFQYVRVGRMRTGTTEPEHTGPAFECNFDVHKDCGKITGTGMWMPENQGFGSVYI
jgi:hypothetical protein